MAGSITIVGTGIMLAAHATEETKAAIRQADKVYFVVTNAATIYWIRQLNPKAESLARFYAPGKERLKTYQEMVQHVITAVRQGHRVCAIFYGHPGIFVTPSHKIIELARREGYPARMMPGISAEACLFADLGFDPGNRGCQTYEATDFLVRPRRFDVHTSLIIWQVGAVGFTDLPKGKRPIKGLALLTEILAEAYGAEHEVTLYQAAIYPMFEPLIRPLLLHTLPQANVPLLATLYVPPLKQAPLDRDRMNQLGLTYEHFVWPNVA